MSPLASSSAVPDAPHFAFPESERHDFTADARSLKELVESEAILPGMRPQLWARLGLSYDPGEFAEDMERRAARADEASRLMDPEGA